MVLVATCLHVKHWEVRLGHDASRVLKRCICTMQRHRDAAAVPSRDRVLVGGENALRDHISDASRATRGLRRGVSGRHLKGAKSFFAHEVKKR